MSSPTPRKINECPTKIYLNSYRLESKNYFKTTEVTAKIKTILEISLQEVEMSEHVLTDLCTTLAENVKNGIKEENFDRYRIIVTVTIGEKKMQGLRTCHSFLWDHQRDRFADYTYETNNFYVQAVVYGVYLD